VAFQASARIELARALHARGNASEALAEARASLATYDAKGDLNGVARAQALLDQLEQRS